MTSKHKSSGAKRGECEVNRESEKAMKPPLSHFQKLAYALRRAYLLGSLLNLTPCGSEVPQWRNWEKFLHIIHNRLDIVFIQFAFENGDLVNDPVKK